MKYFVETISLIWVQVALGTLPVSALIYQYHTQLINFGWY